MARPPADHDDLVPSYTVDKPITPRVPGHLRSRPITKDDFDKIVQVVDQWWEGPIAVLVHPIFFYEFGRYARVVEDTSSPNRGGKFVGFLLGLVTIDIEGEPPVGYVHLVGIDPAYRRKGVARALYADFGAMCETIGCRMLKAVTTVGNEGSMRFHEALGWTLAEDPNYAGPGRRRLVMTRPLSRETA